MGGINDAIEQLYATFSGYPLRHPVEGCPHCVTPADQQRLTRAPLRDLTSDDLSRYGFKAMTTWGDADDFKHFLPRLLELAAAEPHDIDLDTVFGKLAHADWQRWPEAERHAVKAYAAALWRHTLRTFPSRIPADEFVRAAARIGDDVRPYLDVWRVMDERPAVLHLAEFVRHSTDDLLPALFKHKAGRGVSRQVLEWLLDARTKAKLEDAFFGRASSGEDAAVISGAVDRLEWLGQAAGRR